MKKIYIVHCWGDTSSDGWYPWLEQKISNEVNKVTRFDMPNTNHPTIDEWVRELDKKVDKLDSNTYFIGHSIGCQTILRYLETKQIDKIGGILFITPWLDLLPKGIEDEESYNIAMPWINTPIDFEKVKKFTNNVRCIFSDDDYFVSIEQKDKFEKLLNAKTIVVKNKGHISADDGINELSEIYDKTVEMLKY